MKRFINRNDELRFLENEYNRTGSSLVIVYGRRRIGKTALVAEFLKGKLGLYFIATEENENENKAAFRKIVAEFTSNELLMNASGLNWDAIFKVWLGSKNDEKILMVIDEFQYLGKANAAFPSVFQRIWDTMLKDENAMVVLCGSHISMMESQTLAYSSPLYGRRTGQIRLRPIPFSHYNEFFPHRSEKELIPYYAVTGGIPKYIELFYDSDDIYMAIEQNILSKSSFLYDEPNFLLKREVSEVGNYFSILKIIAAGNRKMSKIAAALEVKQTGLTKYLKTLIELDILEREVPITEDNPEKSKRGLYRIKDCFIMFWFRFIYPNLSYIESGNVTWAAKKIKDNLMDSHVSFVYESLCAEKMWHLSSAGTWGFTFNKVGRWWNNETEIDIVAIDRDGKNIIFGECKYTSSITGIDVIYGLEKKSQLVDWNKHARSDFYVLFSVSGFTAELVKLAEARHDLVLVE